MLGEPSARAYAAQAALLEHFTVGNGPLFREHAPARLGDRRYAFLWPFGQAFAAQLDLAAMPGDGSARVAGARGLARSFFEHYWDEAARPPGGASSPLRDGGGDKYFDDNAWIGLELVALGRAGGDERDFAGAARIFDFLIAGWDDDPAHPAPGGIFWTLAPNNRDRNTVCTAPTAQLAIHLHEHSGDGRYLTWARRLLDWTDRTLRDPVDGLYWDHIALDGRIDRTKWSYNQGTMLGALALLHKVTGEAAPLEQARRIAAAALAHYAAGDRLWAQDPAFNAIFFRNLHLLTTISDVAGEPAEPGAAIAAEFAATLAAYAGRAWEHGRDPRTGLFHFGRRGPVPLLNQAAAVRLFALLAAVQSAP